MSSPLGSLHAAATTAAHSLPFSGRWLFPSGSITPLASPPASAPTRQLVSPRPQLMQPYDSYNFGPGHNPPQHSPMYSHPNTQMVRQDSGLAHRDPRQREKTPTGMLLSSECDHCGNRVSIEVPRWMTDAMDAGGRALHDSVRMAPLEGVGAGHSGGREWREGIVSGAVGVAKAIKNSPIPPLFVACVKAVVGMMIYLNRRFELHQRLAAVVIAVLEGLVEIEREVGLLRKGGEGLSVLWEAFVKGSIALAKTDPAPTGYQPAPAPAFASYATPASHQAQHPARQARSLPVSPHHRPVNTPYPTAPAATRSPFLEPQAVVGYSADSEGESEDGPHFRLDDVDPRSPSHAAYPTPELLVPGAVSTRRSSSQSLRRHARSTPSLKEAAKAGRREGSSGGAFPFPSSGQEQLGLSGGRGKAVRQRSRSEVSAGGTLLERRGSGSGGMRSKVMSMTGFAPEAERGWMGKFVAGAAERMGAM